MALAHYVRIRPRAGLWDADTPQYTEAQPWGPGMGTAIPFYPHGHEEALWNGRRNPRPCHHVHTACRACVATWDLDYEVCLTIMDGPSVAPIVQADRARDPRPRPCTCLHMPWVHAMPGTWDLGPCNAEGCDCAGYDDSVLRPEFAGARS